MQMMTMFYGAGVVLLGATSTSNVIRLTAFDNDNRPHSHLHPPFRSKPDLRKFDPVDIDKRAKQIAARFSIRYNKQNKQPLTTAEFATIVNRATSQITKRYLPDLPLHRDIHDELLRDKEWLRVPRQKKPHLTLIN